MDDWLVGRRESLTVSSMHGPLRQWEGEWWLGEDSATTMIHSGTIYLNLIKLLVFCSGTDFGLFGPRLIQL